VPRSQSVVSVLGFYMNNNKKLKVFLQKILISEQSWWCYNKEQLRLCPAISDLAIWVLAVLLRKLSSTKLLTKVLIHTTNVGSSSLSTLITLIPEIMSIPKSKNLKTLRTLCPCISLTTRISSTDGFQVWILGGWEETEYLILSMCTLSQQHHYFSTNSLISQQDSKSWLLFLFCSRTLESETRLLILISKKPILEICSTKTKKSLNISTMKLCTFLIMISNISLDILMQWNSLNTPTR